jgi:hypothetical protein
LDVLVLLLFREVLEATLNAAKKMTELHNGHKTYDCVASWDRTLASRVSRRAVCAGLSPTFASTLPTSSSPTPVMSFWMMPSSEKRPTHVMSMEPVPFMIEVPDSMNGLSSDFFTSSDSPVSADSSHATSEP